MDPQSNDFASELAAAQRGLYALILTLLPNRAAADDLLQETNLTLVSKANEFEEGTNFFAWACRIARYHVLNYRRKQARDQLVFNEQLFEELSSRLTNRADDAQRYLTPLRECLSKLPSDQRAMLTERYAPDGSVAEIARRHGRSAGAVSQLLYRLRENLLNCITLRLHQDMP